MIRIFTLIVFISLLTSCTKQVDGDPYRVSYYYPNIPAPPSPVIPQNWWQRILHPRGIVHGRLWLPDGRPYENVRFDCDRLGQLGESSEGDPLSPDGSFTCGGKTGIYNLTIGDWTTSIVVAVGEKNDLDIIVPQE